MALKDILQRLTNKQQPEENEVPSGRRGFWVGVILLGALLGWNLFTETLMPKHERQSQARAEKYASANSHDYVRVPAEQEQQKSPPRQQTQTPAPQTEARRSPPPRQKKETEEQKLAREARNRSHYAGPLDEAWRSNSARVASGGPQANGNGHGQNEKPGQTLEVPAVRNASATNGKRGEEYAQGDVWNRDFYERSKGQVGVLQPPQSPYMVMRGTVIPVRLLTNINTENPGQVSAVVTQDVMDTATGRYVMIPHDTILIGGYDTKLAYDQHKLPTAWDQMNFPNGETMKLSAFPGADRYGAAGMPVEVDNHFWRTVGRAAMLTLSGAVARTGSYGGSQDFNEALEQQGSRELDRTTRQTWARGGYKGPTGTAEAGEVFLVQVTENLGPFPGDYRERAGNAYALTE